MATTVTTLPTDIKARPYDALELKEIYNVGDVAAAGSVDISAIKAAVTAATDDAVDDIETALDGNTTTLKGHIDTLTSAFMAMYPFENETAFDDAVDTLNSDIDSLIDADIPLDFPTIKIDIATDTDTAIDSVPSGGDVTYHDVLATIDTDYLDLAKNDTTTNPPSGLTYVCPQCLGTGLAATYNQDGSPTGETVNCPTCDAYGYTAVQKQLDPNSKSYIDVP